MVFCEVWLRILEHSLAACKTLAMPKNRRRHDRVECRATAISPDPQTHALLHLDQCACVRRLLRLYSSQQGALS
jgi:hypothetical protein